MAAFKRKLTALSSVLGVLVIVYVLSFVFDTENSQKRASVYRWLESGAASTASRVEISSESATLRLVKEGGKWQYVNDGQFYPVKETRMDELFDAFTKSGSYAVRGKASVIASDAGVGRDSPSHIKIYDGETVILDLIVGEKDAGGGVHLRSALEDVVRGGEDRFSTFIDASPREWLDLRLFDDTTRFDHNAVQRIRVKTPAREDGEEIAPSVRYTLVKQGDVWTVETPPAGVDGAFNADGAASIARNIAEGVADDFSYALSPSDAVFTENAAAGYTSIELTDGRVITLALYTDGDGKNYAAISGAPHVFEVSSWLAGRIFSGTSGLWRE